MRYRLGLLQDTATIEKQLARDAAEAKKPPTVKTEAETKADDARAHDAEKGKEPKKKPKIRPLSEAKAIDLGANFVSETFLLAVGIALILFENARKGRQEATRREDVADQIEVLQTMNKLQRKTLVTMDKELISLRTKAGMNPENNHSLLPKQLRDIEEEEEEEDKTKSKGWVFWVQGLFQSQNAKVKNPDTSVKEAPETAKEVSPTEPAAATFASVLSKTVQKTRSLGNDSNAIDHATEINEKNKNTPPNIIHQDAKSRPS